ncbi:hypothetical protein [Kitasatospora sp. NBC_01266]|uniref:hypothetical protein n=1 Tax=Kitasatospora sp. NBC_01266 TaxID=2903572 RepID=UPI002E33E709|nr:hypothetical protein [Kitasatospora sp. NBC_01266]
MARISRRLVSDLLEAAGLVLLDAAAWCWCVPAGLVVAGAALLLAGLAVDG